MRTVYTSQRVIDLHLAVRMIPVLDTGKRVSLHLSYVMNDLLVFTSADLQL